jgi:RNA polymerase sigma factor (sigma-70 family)
MSDDSKDPPRNDEDAPHDDENVPVDEKDTGEENDGPVDGDDPSLPPLDPAIVRRFLASKQARDVARAAIEPVVPPGEVEALVHDALVRALTADPPHVEAALVSWMYRIATRTAADWLKKRKRRRKYEGDMPAQVAREDDYTGAPIDDGDGEDAGAAYDPEEDREPVKMLGDDLDELVGDDAKERELRDILRERADGKSYKKIASERGYTEAQIANRIYRLKQKYGPRIKRRRRNRMLIWIFGGVAAAVAVAILVWWALHRDAGDIRPDPSKAAPPVPSATATAPDEDVFTPAVPTRNDADAGGKPGDKPTR